MPFASLLFADDSPGMDAAAIPRSIPQEPAFFVDLNLDQVVADLTTGRAQYHLEEFYRAPLHTVPAIGDRQQIFQDLERGDLRARMAAFADRMTRIRQGLQQAAELRHPYQRERWNLYTAAEYCGAVTTLAADVAAADLRSRGLTDFRQFLTDHTAGTPFTALAADTHRLGKDLAGICYCLQITGNRIRVTPYDAEPDYSAAVQDTFARFKQGAVKDYRVAFPAYPAMNHVEAGVLDLVAEIYPGIFTDLDRYCADHQDFVDATIAAFDRHLQFYLAYLDYIEPMKQAGLPFCYPQISGQTKDVHAESTFDLALAHKLTVTQPGTVVCNDFSLTGPERILVVSGPNNGGKTTFARTFGQLHYLAELGVPVPGRSARLFLCDQLFTHFERAEAPEALRGKLQDELVRIHAILDAATGHSIVIMNELFTSTTVHDAVFLGTNIIQAIVERDLLGVYVTFVDELARLGDATVSMVSAVEPDNPTARTCRLVRKPADGNAYAASIAQRFGLDYPRLKKRLAS